MPDPDKADEILDLDALLTSDDKPAPKKKAAARPPEPEPDNALLARIREVEAELAKPVPVPEPTPEPAAFVPTEKLSPDEQKLRDLEDALAKRKADALVAAPVEYDNSGHEGENVILIHILEDGFIFNGVTWYKGQEVEFVVGSLAYEQTKDRNGWTWLDIAGDPAAQYRKWRKQYIGLGPWPGLPWGAIDTENLTPEEAEAARMAATKEAERSRRAPVLRA
jgi:hypothetical protein